MNRQMTFDDANTWLKGRVNTPSMLSSLELSENLPAEVRAHCFFSAKVAQARVLEKLRDCSDRYAQGASSLAMIRGEMKEFLVASGYRADDVSWANTPVPGLSIEEAKALKNIGNLASTSRLNLILKQNTAIAHAIGQRQVSMEPEIMERWPFFRYIARSGARDSHAALHNLVLLKTDPFWHTHTPPWDFNCRCDLEDCDESEAAKYGGINKSPVISKSEIVIDNNGRMIRIPRINGSGYEFNVDSIVGDRVSTFGTCDMSRVNNLPYRRVVFDLIRREAKKGNMRFVCTPGAATLEAAPATGSIVKATEYIDKQLHSYSHTGQWLDDSAEIGVLSDDLRDSLGVTEQSKIFISRGNKRFGMQHQKENKHLDDVRDGTFIRALKETLFASNNTRFAIDIHNKAFVTTVRNIETNAFTTLRKTGEEFDWQVVSAHYPSTDYQNRNQRQGKQRVKKLNR